MSEVLFDNKDLKPNDNLLAEKMGLCYQYWGEIKNYLKKQYGDTTEEWKFYGKKYGWQLKTLLKKRNLFFLIPHQFCCQLVFVFGDKAVQEIENSDISDELKKKVLNAKKYAEGRGLVVEVKDNTSISDIKKLIEIKINN